jgi:radical SAM protein with 4Fe4S-binding SPASM domain
MSSCHAEISGFEFDQDLIAQTVARLGLLSMEIELGRRCNFACPYCYAATEDDFADELTASEVRDVVAQAQELGARKIIILGGEPMIHPRLFETVEFLHSRGLEVDMFTNGTGMTGDKARHLFQHGVNVVVKMNSFDQATQDRMCGHKGAYRLIQNALTCLEEAGYPAKNGAPFLAISTIMSKLNEHELVDLWKWARDRAILPYFELVTPQGRAIRTDWASLESARARALFDEICEIDRSQYGHNWCPQPPLVANKCQRHKYSCLVAANGDVMPCVGVTIPVGNIRKNSLREILQDSEIIQDLRHHRSFIKGPCRSCAKAETCYGCRGAAYNLTGDYLASDPTCWQNVERQDEITRLPSPIAAYVPHEPPMLALDTLLSVGERSAKTRVTIRREMPLVDGDGILDETAYIEMIAQSTAAMDGFRKLANGSRPEGLLLGAKSMRILGTARVGDVLDVAVFKAARFGDFGIVQGSVRKGDTTLAEGEVKVWQKGAASHDMAT